MRITKKLLIVGCGRSGTRYTTKVLCRAGLNVGHETDGEIGRVDWNYVHPPPGEIGRYSLVLHQVRHPLRVIESFHSAGRASWGRIAKADPEIMGGTLLERCVRYWVRWNAAAERMAAWTYRVEDMEDVVPRILSACGKDLFRIDLRSALVVPKTDHSRRGNHKHSVRIPIVTVKSVEEAAPGDVGKLIEMASRYGYDFS